MMAVYNRYEGNTGRFRRVDDSYAGENRQEKPRENRSRDSYNKRENQSGSTRNGGNNGAGSYGGRSNGNCNNGNYRSENYSHREMNAAGPRRKPGLIKDLQNLLPNSIGDLETEDLILLLILYLMYRESGDSELLIIMGAMFLL